MSVIQLEPVILFDANMYIVDGDKPVLVDSGTGFKAEDNIEAIKKILGSRELEAIVLTHRHFDHVGGAAAIAAATGAKIYAGEADAVPLREGDSASTMGLEFGGTIPEMDVIGLHEGDIIETGTHKLRVMETPGHTIGSICLLDEVEGALITGDTLFVNGVGRFDLPTASRKELVRSVRRLQETPAKSMHPGHGPVFHGDLREQAAFGLRMLGEML